MLRWLSSKSRVQAISTHKTSLLGPEQPTLFELFARRLHFPYPAVCLICTIIPGYAAFNFGPIIGQSPQGWILFSLLAFYMFYLIRYLRLTVVSAEKAILPVCPAGEETFHRAFGRISDRKTQIAFILIFALLGPYYVRLYFVRLLTPDLLHLLLGVGLVISFSVAWGSVFSVFLSSLLGLRYLGRNPLDLKSCYEDTMLGVRPLGSLSLRLTAVYLSIGVFGALVPAPFADAASIVPLFIFTAFGVVIFFIPLTHIHRLMQREKEQQQASILQRFSDMLPKPRKKTIQSKDSTLTDLENLLRENNDLLALDLSERKISGLPTWPFDGKILSQLAIIVLSVAAIIIAQVIIAALHLL